MAGESSGKITRSGQTSCVDITLSKTGGVLTLGECLYTSLKDVSEISNDYHVNRELMQLKLCRFSKTELANLIIQFVDNAKEVVTAYENPTKS